MKPRAANDNYNHMIPEYIGTASGIALVIALVCVVFLGGCASAGANYRADLRLPGGRPTVTVHFATN